MNMEEREEIVEYIKYLLKSLTRLQRELLQRLLEYTKE
jgi:hypothetical protein